ncbi:hypothetical protein B0A48_13683 [Cryoendolithus antarcticus]|uniref:Uncharacterized protein n=1 Tax=Cryoendolithus antarcticus TaxID=1507870 RepID=A0A1V8SMD7_9PEZI|nr:hypothetical protein B0A48_13683 [Cryoendolithus antarcticus]
MPTPTRPSYRRALSSYTSKNKPRLYIAIYQRGGGVANTPTSSSFCDSYHWALIVGPPTSGREDPGTRYHFSHSSSLSKHTSTPAAGILRRESTHTFLYSSDDLVEAPAARAALLCRISVAKVIDTAAVEATLRTLGPGNETDASTYTCFNWVQEAFLKLHEAGCLKSYFDGSDWREVEKICRDYVREKRQQGRFVEGDVGQWDNNAVATYCAWQYRETTA